MYNMYCCTTVYVVHTYMNNFYEELTMNDNLETLELNDEQLEAVVGGSVTGPITVSPVIAPNVNTQFNTSTVAEGNVVLWSKVSDSSIGAANVRQTNLSA
jgi:hypothetical protein